MLIVMYEKLSYVKMLKLIVFTFLHFAVANSTLSFDEISSDFYSIARCICEVSKYELSSRPTTVFKVEENQTKSKSGFMNEITKVFVTENSPFFSTEGVDNGTFDGNGNYLYVDYFGVGSMLLDFDFHAIKKHVKYLLVIEDYSVKFWDVDLQSIRHKIGKYDVTIIVKTAAQYKMVTFIPTIDPNSCQIVIGNSLEVNICENGSLSRNVTFPSKRITNLQLCPFKAGLCELYPFGIIEDPESLNMLDSLKEVNVQGLDVGMLKIITDYYNATLEMYYILKQQGNPYPFDQYLPYVTNGSVEVIVGGLPGRVFGEVVAYSGVYASQAVVWMYTAERQSLTWENLIGEMDGLYIFIIFYIVYCIIWYIICLFDKYAISMKDTLLYSWGALMGTTSLLPANSFKQKILNLVYLIMCLHLSAYFSIQLFSFLTILKPPEILITNDDIYNSGRVPFIKPEYKYPLRDPKIESFQKNSRDCPSSYECVLAMLREKGVGPYFDCHILQWQAETLVGDEARLLRVKESIVVMHFEMIINLNSPLLEQYQIATTRLFESGITEKLFESAIGITKLDKTKIATKNIMSKSYGCYEGGCSITFEQISGAFYVWALGCAIGIALFFIELVFRKQNFI